MIPRVDLSFDHQAGVFVSLVEMQGQSSALFLASAVFPVNQVINSNSYKTMRSPLWSEGTALSAIMGKRIGQLTRLKALCVHMLRIFSSMHISICACVFALHRFWSNECHVPYLHTFCFHSPNLLTYHIPNPGYWSCHCPTLKSLFCIKWRVKLISQVLIEISESLSLPLFPSGPT